MKVWSQDSSLVVRHQTWIINFITDFIFLFILNRKDEENMVVGDCNKINQKFAHMLDIRGSILKLIN
jgi:hypothetical protein